MQTLPPVLLQPPAQKRGKAFEPKHILTAVDKEGPPVKLLLPETTFSQNTPHAPSTCRHLLTHFCLEKCGMKEKRKLHALINIGFSCTGTGTMRAASVSMHCKREEQEFA